MLFRSYKMQGRCRNENWAKKSGALPQREMGSMKSGALPQREMGSIKAGALPQQELVNMKSGGAAAESTGQYKKQIGRASWRERV